MKKNPCCVFVGVALMVLAGLTVGCGGRGGGEITMEQAKAVMDVYLKARNEANLELLDGIYSPGVVIHDPSQPGPPIAGLQALKAQYGNTHDALPDLKFSVDDFSIKGNRLVWVFTMSGTFTKPFLTPVGEVQPTGKPIRFSGVCIDRLADGKIAEEWLYFNVLELLGPMGFQVVPPGASGQLPGLVKAVAWDDLTQRFAVGGAELRFAAMGDMLLTFYRLPKGTNFDVFFKGLPDDMCPSRHWAYLLKGKFRIRTKSGEVTVKPGQAFYVPPGHVPEALEDSEFVEFSPAGEFKPVVENALRLAKARRGEK